MRHYLVTFIEDNKEKAEIYVEDYSITDAESRAVNFYEENLMRRFGDLPYTIALISSEEYYSHKNAHDQRPEYYTEEHYLIYK